MSATATSILAYNQIRESGLLTKARFLVYEALCLKGPMTGNEVDRVLRSVSAHKRLIELHDLGVVEIIRERHCSVTGRLCAEWGALDRLPVGEVRKSKARTRKEIIKENERLRKELEDLQRQLGRQMSLFGDEANQ